MESPWQPIRTAPKDGTKIVYVDDDPSFGECECNGDAWWDEREDHECYPTLWAPSPMSADLHK